MNVNLKRTKLEGIGMDSWSPGRRHRLLTEIEPDDYSEEQDYLNYLKELTERRCRFSLRRVFQRLLEVKTNCRQLISTTVDLTNDFHLLYSHLNQTIVNSSKLRADLEDMWYLDHIIECLGRQEQSITLVPYRIDDC